MSKDSRGLLQDIHPYLKPGLVPWRIFCSATSLFRSCIQFISGKNTGKYCCDSDTSPGFDTVCTGLSLVTPAKPPRLCRYSICMHFQKRWKRQAFAPRLLILWWISGVLILLQASRYDHVPKAGWASCKLQSALLSLAFILPLSPPAGQRCEYRHCSGIARKALNPLSKPQHFCRMAKQQE